MTDYSKTTLLSAGTVGATLFALAGAPPADIASSVLLIQIDEGQNSEQLKVASIVGTAVTTAPALRAHAAGTVVRFLVTAEGIASSQVATAANLTDGTVRGSLYTGRRVTVSSENRDYICCNTRGNGGWVRSSGDLEYLNIYDVVTRLIAILGTSILNAYFPDDATYDGSGNVLTIPPRIGSDTLTQRHTTDYFTLTQVNGRTFLTNSTNTNKSLQNSNATATKAIIAVLMPAATSQGGYGSAVSAAAGGNTDPQLLQFNTTHWYAANAYYSVNGAMNPYIYTTGDVYCVTNPTGAAGLAVGGITNQARDFLGKIGAVIQLSAVPSTAQLLEVSRLLRRYYELDKIVPVRFYGDSLTLDASDSIPWSQSLNVAAKAHCTNFGYAGYTTSLLLTRMQNELKLYNANERKRIVGIWAGTNDIGGGASDAAATLAGIYAMCDYARSQGDLVALANITPRNDVAWSDPKEAIRLSVNSDLAANWTQHANAFVDLANATHLTDPNDTNYFNADKLHLVTAGYAIVGGLFSTAIAGLL